jgi:hypothetical protein
MPVLVPSEECQSSIFALPKQNVVIFDGRRPAHEPCIRDIFADFAEIVWVEEFSRENFDRGGVSHGISVSDLFNLNLVLFVTELELMPPIHWMDGIRLLENIRNIPGFKLVPPALVITNSEALCRAHHNFKRLGVRWAFTWKGLRYSSEQDRFRCIVKQSVEGH